MTGQECPQDLLVETLEVASRDDDLGLERIDALLRDYDGDGRLHFLKGSLLAGLKRYDEAMTAMTRAVEVAPGYAVARFQLGFLKLTSGDAMGAAQTWLPLETDLPPEEPLRLFATGLTLLAQDQFETAIEVLRAGIARNTVNPAMNGDMQLIIDEALVKIAERDAAKAVEAAAGSADEEEPTSAVDMLLRQYGERPTKH